MAKMFFKNGNDWMNFLAIVYPIDSIYITVSDDSPAQLIGGTWNELKGRYYLRTFTAAGNEGYGETGTTGGSNYITVSQLPAHSHPQNRYTFLSRTSAAKRFTNASSGYYIGTVDETGEALTQSTGGGARYTYPPITSSMCGDVPPRKIWVVM